MPRVIVDEDNRTPCESLKDFGSPLIRVTAHESLRYTAMTPLIPNGVLTATETFELRLTFLRQVRVTNT